MVADAPRPWVPPRYVVRDVVLLAVAVGMWQLDTRMHGEPGWTPVAVSVLTALATLAPAALAHEWGHLIGAWSGRSVVHFPDGIVDKLLFDFDVERNDARQFLRMSYGGYVASVLTLALFWLVLPAGRLTTWIVLIGAAVGIAVQFAIELPHTIQVLRGGPIPRPLVTVTKQVD